MKPKLILGNCLIVRVVETRGVHARGELVCASAKARIVETDLMEWHDRQPAATSRLAIAPKPFEIRTFKVWE